MKQYEIPEGSVVHDPEFETRLHEMHSQMGVPAHLHGCGNHVELPAQSQIDNGGSDGDKENKSTKES